MICAEIQFFSTLFISSLINRMQTHFQYKKVLLRERKRHTARRVASTPYVVLTGYPPGQGTPLSGYPPARVPPGQGTPPCRVPPLARVPPWGRVPPMARVPPHLNLVGYPPGYPMAFWEMLQSIMGYGYLNG